LTPLGIVFSQPEMAIVGQSFQQLTQSKAEFVTGFVSYKNQGRAMVLGKNQGAVEVYIETATRKFLGSELFV
ncbi:dihydrolipoyl dehydrogenase, partial [Bifidobacterium pseudocatenulatum]|nr:dihydrolipoyl dehydrogenase [Bifidobacterium pseudocatenulatum]